MRSIRKLVSGHLCGILYKCTDLFKDSLFFLLGLYKKHLKVSRRFSQNANFQLIVSALICARICANLREIKIKGLSKHNGYPVYTKKHFFYFPIQLILQAERGYSSDGAEKLPSDVGGWLSFSSILENHLIRYWRILIFGTRALQSFSFS
jgi:hypothetical protein